MKYIKTLIIFTLLLFNISCSSDDPTIENNDPNGTSTVKYTVEFIATWSQETHPNEFPSSAHFSGLVGATHKAGVNLFEKGETASPGIKNMAETGSKTQFKTEIESLISSENAGFIIDGPGVGSSPGKATTEFEIAESHSFVTVTTMIAPSPDWFVAVSSVNLYENNAWAEEMEVEVGAYDAGTDSGETFTSSNEITNPFQPITEITDGPLSSFGVVPSLGTMKFTRIE